MKNIFLIICVLAFLSCKEKNTNPVEVKKAPQKEFVWEGANVYFLLTDRFNNGDTSNDINFNRTKEKGNNGNRSSFG